MKKLRSALAAALLAAASADAFAHDGPEEHGTPDASRRVSTEVSKKANEGAIVLAKATDLSGRVVVAVNVMPDLAKEDPVVVLDPVPRFKPGERPVVRKPSPGMEKTHETRELAGVVGEAKTKADHVAGKKTADASGSQSDRSQKLVSGYGKPIAPAPGELSKAHEVDIERVFNSGLKTMGSALSVERIGAYQYTMNGQESFLGETVGVQVPVGTEIYKAPEPRPKP